MNDPIKVYVGGGEEHWLPTVVLEHSIRSHTARAVEVITLAAVEALIPIPVPRNPANRAVTSFSFQRFLIPEHLGFTGCGIYLDSDMIVQADIGELWDTPFPVGARVQMCPGWQSAVMLIDGRCGWKISDLVARMDAGALGYKDLVNVKHLGLCANTLDARWNVIDRPNPQAMDVKRAKLLHYTDMRLQPWLTARHPHGGVWTAALQAAIADGFLTVEDVLREIEHGSVRPSLALCVNEEPLYADADFVYPDHKRKGAA